MAGRQHRVRRASFRLSVSCQACLKKEAVLDHGESVYNCSSMSKTTHVRRVVVCLLLAAVLLAAMSPHAIDLLHAILGIVLFFIVISISIPLSEVDEQGHAQPFLAVPAFSPRPPPAL